MKRRTLLEKIGAAALTVDLKRLEPDDSAVDAAARGRGDPVITRRRIVLAGGIGLLIAHPLGRGQPAATIRRVGWLASASQAATPHLRAAFKQGMQDLGWLKGRMSSIATSTMAILPFDALARELIEQKRRDSARERAAPKRRTGPRRR